MDKLRCAVIGLGMGQQHVRGYVANPRAELVGVADLDEKRFAKAREIAPGVKTFTDYKRLLEDCKPDVVSVALPNFLHEPVSVACLEAGAQVMCEKPMAHTLASALRIGHAVERTGKTLFMNLSQRFRAQNMAARRIMEAGGFGEVYHGYTEWTRRNWIPGFGGWFGQKEMSGGGPMLDIGVHKIDIALWLMARPKPVTVSGTVHFRRGVPLAKAQGVNFDVEDYACGFVRFENGASLMFETSWAGYQQTYSQESMKLIGLPSRMRLPRAGVPTMTSRAATRPFPSVVRSSCCATTPRRLSPSMARICSCWSAGKALMMRSTVLAAELVWSVPKTRCPVSAAVSPNSNVS